MPELPEVETIRRELAPRVVGQTVVSVRLLWPQAVATPDPERFVQEMRGRRIEALCRRGKFLIFQLSGGRSLAIHLRMTGQLHLLPATEALHPHTRAVIYLDNNRALHFRDQRKFGRLYLVEDLETVVGSLGPEPLEASWQPEDLWQSLQGRRAPIKSVLLDQRVVAGLGNIYADEALFVAGLHPLRPANTLTQEEVRRLHTAIRKVLTEAITHGGTTIRTYRRPGGTTGRYQRHRRVYGRENHPCPRCGTPIQRTRVGGRSAHFCPRCQPENTSSAASPARR